MPSFNNKIRQTLIVALLIFSNVLSNVEGFVFGQCSDCKPGSGYGAFTVDQIMDQYIIPLNIPAYIGAMIGHIPKQFIIPVGAGVRLNADQGSITLLEKVFRTS